MKQLITLLLVSVLFYSHAQDIDYVRTVVDTLAAPGMHGRGYVSNGDQIASDYIASAFEKAGLKTFNVGYFQQFYLPMNTFPDSIHVAYGDRILKPGREYTVLSDSPGTDGTYELVALMDDSTKNIFEELKDKGSDLKNKIILTDVGMQEMQKLTDLNAAGYIFLVDKVGWHVSQAFEVKPYFKLELLKEIYDPEFTKISLRYRNHFIKKYKTRNVIGYIEGKKHTDKYLVLSAHYDHLGRMGPETYFPGANDNASGTAMLLDLARYYSRPENQPSISIVFMAFAAEEAGLVGSSYYVTHPLIPLDKIEFMINLDMVGSGSEGIKVVNGAVYEKAFKKLVKINDQNGYLVKVGKRGKAANSDHYPFYYKGIPSFFIYTLGPECKEYHNIYDMPENVPFTEYNDLFALLTRFIKTFK